jgi:hypothetical protein
MSMKKKIAGLTILARRNNQQLTENDWLDLIKARQNLIAPHLRSMSLKTLGSLKIIHDDINTGAGNGRELQLGGLVTMTMIDPHRTKYLGATIPEGIESGDYSFETRGIFANDEIFYHSHYHWEPIKPTNGCPAGGDILRFWGLTRDNDWIKIECLLQTIIDPYDFGSKRRRTHTKKVIVSKSNPKEICEFCHFNLKWLHDRLGDAVEAWLKHREKLLQEATALATLIRAEKNMIEIIDSLK